MTVEKPIEVDIIDIAVLAGFPAKKIEKLFETKKFGCCCGR